MRLSDLHPTIRLRIAIAFTQRLVDSMVMSFMAIYLASRFGLTAAGAVTVAVMTVAVGGALWGGRLADRWGRRPALLAGEAAITASFAAMAIAHSVAGASSTALVVAGYAVNKLAAGLAMPANEAMIVDLSSSEDRTFVYTLNYWSVNLALAVGAVLGGFLFRTHFHVVLTAAAVAMAGALTATALWVAESKPALPETAGDARQGRRTTATGYRQVLRDILFARFVLAVTLVMTIELQLINWIGVRISLDVESQTLVLLGGHGLHLDGVRLLGLLRAENTVLVVAGAFVVHRALRAVSVRGRMLGGLSLFVAGYMVLAVADSPWLLLGAVLVLTVGELMDAPARQALLADLVPAEARPRYMAVYSLHIRVALVAAAAGISLGALVPGWAMAAIYAALGLVIAGQYRALLDARALRPTSTHPPRPVVSSTARST